jgi:hypothetical protein
VADTRRGPPGNKGKPKRFQVSIPLNHYEYLTLLAAMNRLGLKESDVAAHILIREIDLMFKSDYHEKKVPKP